MRSADDAPAELAAAIRANYEAQPDAMVAGDAEGLGALLAEGFTLTHMTGQPAQGRVAGGIVPIPGTTKQHRVEENTPLPDEPARVRDDFAAFAAAREEPK
jgi:hypothetical protein